MSGRQLYQIKQKTFIIIICSLLLLSCTTIRKTRVVCIPSFTKIVVLPFNNLTETPQADDRVQSITTDVLRTKGYLNVKSYPRRQQKPSLIPGVKQPIPMSSQIQWAKRQGAKYAISGDVTEWNYKVGLDGEPAVGINLQLINVATGQVIWAAVGGKIGGSRTAISQTGIELVSELTAGIRK